MQFFSEKHAPIEKRGFFKKIKDFFKKEYFENIFVLWLLGIGLFINIANWIVLVVFIKPVDFPIILHYNVYFGVDMIGDWKRVFLLPLIGLFLYILNSFLSLFFYEKKERIAGHILLIANIIIQINLIIATASLILINY